jgi:ActR/RegA family two-component response regulator
LSGYFEPNSTLEDQMYPGDMNDMDEDEEEGEEEEEAFEQNLKTLKKLVNGGKKDVKAAVEGLKNGADIIDKSLKAANKNTMKNAMEAESEDSDDDDEES